MMPNRFYSRSQPESVASRNSRPQEIVLLEDENLYRYHEKLPSFQQDDHEAIPVAQTYEAAPQYPVRSTTSFVPSMSDRGSDYGYASRAFQLHATPYGLSSVRKSSMTSVDTIPLTHGALRPGGSVDLFSRNYVGLLLNWCLVGFFNGTLSGLVTPFFENYLGYDDHQSTAASTLIDLPWLFKFAAGFISDSFPIRRQRRKPYIYIGWASFAVFMVAMMLMNEPRPKHVNKPDYYPDAPSQGLRYIVSIIVGSMGQLLATVAVEGTMVEYAQREGEFVRGRTQSWCLIARFSGEALGAFAMTLALYDEDFGGTFDSAVPLRVVFAAQAVLAIFGLVVTKLWFHEELTTITSQRLTTQFRRIWSIIQKRTTWQITIFGFIIKSVSTYEVKGYTKIYEVWMGAGELTTNANDAIGSIGYVIASAIFMHFLLNTNWRKILVAVIVSGLVVMIPIDMITVFDVFRSLPFYLLKIQIVSVLDAFLFILRVAVIIEVAEPGYEAVSYGLLTTVFNLANMVVAMSKAIAARNWDDSITNIRKDTSAVRWHLAYQFFFKYGLRILGMLVVLPLLPRQKRHLKERNLNGPSTLVAPILLFVLFAVLFAVSLTSSILALFESTSCMILAGGDGCKDSHDAANSTAHTL